MTKLDQKYILEDLLFDYDSYKLTESVKNFLFLYAQWLKQNDEINIRIEGHTDSVGSDNYNMTLSENRAKEVLNFFVSDSIPHSPASKTVLLLFQLLAVSLLCFCSAVNVTVILSKQKYLNLLYYFLQVLNYLLRHLKYNF